MFSTPKNNSTHFELDTFIKNTFRLISLLGLLVILAGVAVVLITVYHTVITLIGFALTPLFLFVLPPLTLSLAFGVVFFKQPVHNLLCLIGVFFTTVLLYIYVGAEFLAFLFLIVYVGAIAILFLFVIMLLNLKELTSAPRISGTGWAYALFPTVVLTVLGLDDLISVALTTFFTISDFLAFRAEDPSSIDALIWYVNNRHTDILTFSSLLYTYYCFLFFLAAILLLTAMLGAIILATSTTEV